MPFAAGLLQALELRAKFAGAASGFRRRFGDIARELGALADFVQLFSALRSGG